MGFRVLNCSPELGLCGGFFGFQISPFLIVLKRDAWGMVFTQSKGGVCEHLVPQSDSFQFCQSSTRRRKKSCGSGNLVFKAGPDFQRINFTNIGQVIIIFFFSQLNTIL